MSQLEVFSISPVKNSERETIPKIHCYEFRTLLQAKHRQLRDDVIRESRELQNIEAALARIGDGSYGICIDCRGETGRARLKVDPTARRCLPCEGLVLPVLPINEHSEQ